MLQLRGQRARELPVPTISVGNLTWYAAPYALPCIAMLTRIKGWHREDANGRARAAPLAAVTALTRNTAALSAPRRSAAPAVGADARLRQ